MGSRVATGQATNQRKCKIQAVRRMEKRVQIGFCWRLSAASVGIFSDQKDKDVDKYVLTPGRFGGKVFFANNVHILAF